MTSSGPSPVPALVAALVVLLAGIAAVVVHDGDGSHEPPPSTLPSTSVPSTTVETASSTTTSGSRTTATPTSVATTVRPPVTSPEAAVNGLWAAYAANNEVAAKRFASDEVIRVLFESPYNGEQGVFQGCRRNADAFDCDYFQSSTRYAMTVKTDPANGFIVIELAVAPR